MDLSENRFAQRLEEVYNKKKKRGHLDFDLLLGWSLRYVLPTVNPDLESFTVYYPCAGDDIMHVLAATAGTRIILLDLNRPMLHKHAGHFIENIVQDLEALGAENIAVGGTAYRKSITFRSEIGVPRTKPLPDYIFPYGHAYSVQEREIVYYLGKNANKCRPLEIKEGIDACFIKGTSALTVLSQKKIIGLIKSKGFLLVNSITGLPDNTVNAVAASDSGLNSIDRGNIAIFQKK